MARVRFRRRSGDVVVDVVVGQDVLGVALAAGLPLASSCAGQGACKACRIAVLAGADELSAADPREREALLAAGAGPDERLACAARVEGDVELTTTYW